MADGAVTADGSVLRHYAFTGHWFKVNVTTGLRGRLTGPRLFTPSHSRGRCACPCRDRTGGNRSLPTLSSGAAVSSSQRDRRDPPEDCTYPLVQEKATRIYY
jgi:hypothetical protein